jgi:hypothetical protein
VNPADNDIATALIASMRRAGVLGRKRNDSPEVAEAVDRHLESGLDYRVAFEPDAEQRAFIRRQGKRIRRLVLRKLGINDRSDVERV